MKTQEAYQQYLINARNEAEFQNTILWLLFVVFVVAPIILALIYIPLAIAKLPKCPDCGSRRLKNVTKKVVEGNITTLESVTVCANCKHQA